jgi:hypothetical protein
LEAGIHHWIADWNTPNQMHDSADEFLTQAQSPYAARRAEW